MQGLQTYHGRMSTLVLHLPLVLALLSRDHATVHPPAVSRLQPCRRAILELWTAKSRLACLARYLSWRARGEVGGRRQRRQWRPTSG